MKDKLKMVNKLQGYYRIVRVHRLSISWILGKLQRTQRGLIHKLMSFFSICCENCYCSVGQLFQMTSQCISCSLFSRFYKRIKPQGPQTSVLCGRISFLCIQKETGYITSLGKFRKEPFSVFSGSYEEYLLKKATQETK